MVPLLGISSSFIVLVWVPSAVFTYKCVLVTQLTYHSGQVSRRNKGRKLTIGQTIMQKGKYFFFFFNTLLLTCVAFTVVMLKTTSRKIAFRG